MHSLETWQTDRGFVSRVSGQGRSCVAGGETPALAEEAAKEGHGAWYNAKDWVGEVVRASAVEFGFCGQQTIEPRNPCHHATGGIARPRETCRDCFAETFQAIE
jgi:hypothetical protein